MFYFLFFSNDIAESFTAPEPTGWGLPLQNITPGTNTQLNSNSNSDTENTFSYQQFPALTPTLFGPVRPARVLLSKPERGRQLSQNSRALQVSIEMRARSLSKADSGKTLVDFAAKKSALKEQMAVAKVRNVRALSSVIKTQSLYRMLAPRRLFLKLLMVRIKIQVPSLFYFILDSFFSFCDFTFFIFVSIFYLFVTLILIIFIFLFNCSL